MQQLPSARTNLYEFQCVNSFHALLQIDLEAEWFENSDVQKNKWNSDYKTSNTYDFTYANHVLQPATINEALKPESYWQHDHNELCVGNATMKISLNIEFFVLMTANSQNSRIYQNNRPRRLAFLPHSGDKQVPILTRNSIILTLGFRVFPNFFQDYHYRIPILYLSGIYTFFFYWAVDNSGS